MSKTTKEIIFENVTRFEDYAPNSRDNLWFSQEEVDEMKTINAQLLVKYAESYEYNLEQLKKELRSAMRSYASTCREECLDFRYDQVLKQIDSVFAKYEVKK
jgi:hypothetical protein